MINFKKFLSETKEGVFKAVVHTIDAEGNKHSTPVESSDSIREKVHKTVKDMTAKGHKLDKVDYEH
jgi:hypothetical protein